jgi:23S rRNA (cytosine1962-C5)-methyltransferase
MFESMLAAVSAETGRRIQILEARGQAPDHPTSATCLENNYLKCYICRVV